MNIRSRLTYSRLRPRGERIADIDQLMIDTAILLDIIHEPFALIGGQRFFLFQSQLLFLQYCKYTASVLIILLRPFKIIHSFVFLSINFIFTAKRLQNLAYSRVLGLYPNDRASVKHHPEAVSLLLLYTILTDISIDFRIFVLIYFKKFTDSRFF